MIATSKMGILHTLGDGLERRPLWEVVSRSLSSRDCYSWLSGLAAFVFYFMVNMYAFDGG